MAARESETPKSTATTECGPTGFIDLIEKGDDILISLQTGCVTYKGGEVTGWIPTPENDQMLTPDEEWHYQLPYEGVYLFISKGEPVLSFLPKGSEERLNAQVPKHKGVYTFRGYMHHLKP